MSAANPPLDAARLDIMPAGLWGRAEGVRTFLRSLAQALAPLVFGGLAALIAGIAAVHETQAPIGTKYIGPVSPSEARGLEIAFLMLLVALVAGGIALLRARHTYPRDVATAAASNQGSRDESGRACSTLATEVTRTDDSRTSRSSHDTPGKREEVTAPERD